MKENFVLELGCEELPPKDLIKLSDAFVASFSAGLKEFSINFDNITGIASPRRLGVYITGLALKGADLEIEKRGPSLAAAYDKNGNATKAALGFASSCKVALEDLQKIQTDKGEWLFYKGVQAGISTKDALQEILQKSVNQLPIGRKMRWGANSFEFVRPLRWLFCLQGESLIDLELFGKKSSNQTYGHRFHSPAQFSIKKAEDYFQELEDKKVIVDFAKRREIIREQIQKLADSKNAQVVWDEDLLDETTALVEYPKAVLGKFEEKYLALPKEALIETMQGHQKYFTLKNTNGALLPNFITIANIESKDEALLIRGNENVVRPRLADCEFFYETDRKQTLASFGKKLADVIFQKDLGSLQDKVDRVKKISLYLGNILNIDADKIARSADLSRNDLLTLMVQELPELQGTAGKYYARLDGEDEQIALALEEQYLPRFAKDALPTSNLGALLAITTRLDTLVGIFAIDKVPTGDKDPFGLRRAAVAIANIIIKRELNFDLLDLIKQSAQEFKFLGVDIEDLSAKVFNYISDRLRALYTQEDNFGIEEFLAVSKQMPTNLLDFDAKLQALSLFIKELDKTKKEALISLNKRVNNILAKQDDSELRKYIELSAIDNLQLSDKNSKNDKNDKLETTDKLLLAEVESAEIIFTNLFSGEEAKAFSKSAQIANLVKSLEVLPKLEQPLNQFFEEVLVMAEDENLRKFRLALIKRVQLLLTKVGDLSLIN